jgi:Transposase
VSSTRPSAWSLRTVCRIATPVGASGAIIASSSLTPRSRTGSRTGGKKAARRIDTEHLDWALSDFSGYIAADELYDGPFCILSIVDNRTFKRLSYRVLDHAPTHADIIAFFRDFRRALAARGLDLKGITTDGSALYPEPIATVFGAIPHQVCTFHVLREITQAILSALAQERQRLAATAPPLPRGRPRATAVAQRAARRKQRIQRKVNDLFTNRYLFVRRRLSASERATLRRISRGLPQLRVLRALMDEVYRLFDRRCRTPAALTKLTALRRRLRHSGRLRSVLKKLFSPGLEKALVFLDERLLGATSNAVERGNRRYRKMQKTVYRVRTRPAIEGRLALDLLRESQAQGRTSTTTVLHKARAA